MITFNILPFLPVTFIIITGLLSAIVIKSAKQSFAWQKKKRSPFTSNFLRAPGQSLGDEIEELKFDLLGIVMKLRHVQNQLRKIVPRMPIWNLMVKP